MARSTCRRGASSNAPKLRNVCHASANVAKTSAKLVTYQKGATGTSSRLVVS